MAKPARAKLKVFQAQFGFFETVVAAPSRAAALRAWGVHQDLFASGAATVTDDPAAIEAAIAHPEKPLRRAVGSRDVFALESARLPKLPAAPKTPRAASRPKARAAPPPKPEADRSGLEAAEKALRALDERRKREEAEFRAQEDDLRARSQAAKSAYATARKKAAVAVAAARRAFREAGGDE